MLFLVITVGTLIGAVYGQSRITGGKETSVVHHPYHVSLQTSSGDHVCSGVLISPVTVLTAAHCVDDLDRSTIKTYKIRAGSNFYNKEGQTVQVEKRIVHIDYDPKSQDSDIAILKLASTVTDKNAGSANLPKKDEDTPDDTYLNVTGWDTTKEGGEQLQFVQLDKISIFVCKKKYGKGKKITNNMFCASSPDNSCCSGDSGGPAAKGNKVYGIVSGGVNCADPEYPGVYTRISVFRKWISEKSGI